MTNDKDFFEGIFDSDDVFFRFKDKKDSTDVKKIRENSGLGV